MYLQVTSRENWLFISKHPKAIGHSDNLYRNEQAEQLRTATKSRQCKKKGTILKMILLKAKILVATSSCKIWI